MSYQPNNYETVAASQTDQVLGTNGKAGDWLERLIVTVATAATSTVTLEDGTGSAITIMAANTPIGVYVITLGMRSRLGGWQLTTGAGATVIAVGDFG